MKVAIVLGTRPEIIKLSPVIRASADRGATVTLIHTNQHYSETMDKIFFEELELPAPHYNLGIGSGAQGDQTGRMLIALEPVLLESKPDVVLVQGDTNSVLAGALVASKLGIKVGHIEAGLRSYDRTMPEEINRIVTDHISDFLFAPTDKQRDILLSEGIEREKIHVVGNTVVDAILQNQELATKRPSLLKKLGIKPDGYLLLTAHRPANVDDKTALGNILNASATLAHELKAKVVFPIHPRTRKNIETFGLTVPEEITLLEPLGYLDMLQLQQDAKLILTDSGGIQEEACILQKKCLTLRDSTERPETLEVGGTLLTGTDPSKIMQSAQTLLAKPVSWYNPFGRGDSSLQILRVLEGALS